MRPRTHFAHTVDRLDGAGKIVEQLAGVEESTISAGVFFGSPMPVQKLNS
jgi:hypothetical protein